MKRKRHPIKEIEHALIYAEKYGWRIEMGGSHTWGRMFCPNNDLECRCGEFCISSIWIISDEIFSIYSKVSFYK